MPHFGDGDKNGAFFYQQQIFFLLPFLQHIRAINEIINEIASITTKAIKTGVPNAAIIPVTALTNKPIKKAKTTAIIAAIIQVQQQFFLLHLSILQ